jgi:hypothetical protein
LLDGSALSGSKLACRIKHLLVEKLKKNEILGRNLGVDLITLLGKLDPSRFLEKLFSVLITVKPYKKI